MWNETKEVKGETRGQVNLLGFVCREGMAKQGTGASVWSWVP